MIERIVIVIWGPRDSCQLKVACICTLPVGGIAKWRKLMMIIRVVVVVTIAGKINETRGWLNAHTFGYKNLARHSRQSRRGCNIPEALDETRARNERGWRKRIANPRLLMYAITKTYLAFVLVSSGENNVPLRVSIA